MTPEQARDTLAGMLIHADVIAPHHAHDAIAVLLADVPLLMLAIGARREWNCGVSESGFHNGANCRPSEPHQGWGCEWILRLTVPWREVQP